MNVVFVKERVHEEAAKRTKYLEDGTLTNVLERVYAELDKEFILDESAHVRRGARVYKFFVTLVDSDCVATLFRRMRRLEGARAAPNDKARWSISDDNILYLHLLDDARTGDRHGNDGDGGCAYACCVQVARFLVRCKNGTCARMSTAEKTRAMDIKDRVIDDMFARESGGAAYIPSASELMARGELPDDIFDKDAEMDDGIVDKEKDNEAGLLGEFESRDILVESAAAAHIVYKTSGGGRRVITLDRNANTISEQVSGDGVQGARKPGGKATMVATKRIVIARSKEHVRAELLNMGVPARDVDELLIKSYGLDKKESIYEQLYRKVGRVTDLRR